MAQKILSVDDSMTMRRMVGRVIATLGFDLLEASQGEEALEVLAANQGEVVLIILDVNMPILDGEETLSRIKADPRFSGIPVMMLTTESERARVFHFIQKGATNYMTKPFTHDDLATKVAGCLGSLM